PRGGAAAGAAAVRLDAAHGARLLRIDPVPRRRRRPVHHPGRRRVRGRAAAAMARGNRRRRRAAARIRSTRMSNGPRDDLLVWLDLEMTGLDPGRDVILEIATIVTDGALEVVAEGPVLAIRRGDDVLEAMAPVVKEMHQKNGLTERCRASTIGPAQAELE